MKKVNNDEQGDEKRKRDTFELKKDYLDHLDERNVLTDKYIKSSECLKAAEEHVERRNGIFTCTLCNKLYSGMDGVRNHVASHHMNLKPYSCRVCNAAYVTSKAVWSHVARVHEPHLAARFKCKICNRQYYGCGGYNTHLKTHGRFLFVCDYCGYGCHYKQSMRTHIVHIHLGEYIKSVMCEICGGLFINQAKLNSHKKQKHSGICYPCTQCSKTFNSPRLLKYHITMHSGEQNYKCDVCSKTFRRRDLISCHLETHFNRKAHKCTVCGRGYALKRTLTEHMLKHEGIRKYSCEQCGKTFAQRSHLNTHAFVHREKRFVCSICGARFNRNDNMKSHEKRHSAVKKVVVKSAAKTPTVKKVVVKSAAKTPTVKKVVVKSAAKTLAVKKVKRKNATTKKKLTEPSDGQTRVPRRRSTRLAISSEDHE